jgi:hypothetical protein
MNGRTLHPLLQRLAALVILGVALGAAGSSLVYPLIDAMAARDAALVRLSRYQGMLQRSPGEIASQNPEDLAAHRLDEPDAQLALQSSVDRLARGAGIAVQSTQPLAAEHLGDIGRGAWMELTFASDLQGLVAFMESLDTQRPLLLVRRLEVDRGDGARPDLFMRAKVQIGQAWRPTGGGT